ncbi:MAG: hypothetical protein K6F24_05335 [Atopobiaceae bacterium]|nr:hypothetical protein [Atopobiaceae bacterium]
MLTKQEREEIAKRFKSCTKVDFSDIYRGLFGIPTPKETTIGEDDKATLNRLIELCDTSDMVELPRDKDGKVIHIGDTVWCSGEKETVKAIEIRDSEARIHFVVPLGCESWSSPELITRAEPISDHESIARAIEDIVYRLNSASASLKLQDIAMEIRELGGSND